MVFGLNQLLTLKADLASPTLTGTVAGVTATMVGLGSVNNTTDANKPVSTATTTALALKANLASPTFTGTVAGITATMVGLANVNNTTDANKPVSTATTTALALKANLASPTLTGTVALTGNMYTDGYIVLGNQAGNSPLVYESALQVCNYRVELPTQFGVHLGTDYGTWDCGMSLCPQYVGNKAHIDFTYVGNTTLYLGQIGYDNTLNNMTFKTNKVNGMVLDS